MRRLRHLALGLIGWVGCQSQKTVGPPNVPPPNPPQHPEESGRRKGGGLLPSGCKWEIDEPFISGDFPITRESDRFFERLEMRLRKEQETFCRTSCGEPNEFFCPHGFPPRESMRSLDCKAYRLDGSVISVGCIESQPSGMRYALTFHALNIRAEGALVKSFDLESLFVPGSDWTTALARGLSAHDELHRDWVKIVSTTSPAWKSPAFFHANVTPTAVALTLMDGATLHSRWGETIEIPFTELTAVLAH